MSAARAESPSSPMSNDAPGYRSFWDEVGETFPSLKGAASTSYYAECERTLPAIRRHGYLIACAATKP